MARWQERVARPIADAPPDSVSALAAERAAEGKVTFDEVRAALSDQERRLRADQARARDDLMTMMTVRNWVFSAIGVLILALAALIFKGLRRGITRPLDQLGADARSHRRR